MTEPRSRVVKCACACSMLCSYNVRSAPGQRDIDWERVGKLASRLQEQKEIRLQPIYMFFDGIKIMYIIDGQHRYHAHLKCCEINIHKPLEVLYELGNEKDAGDAYDLQLMAIPQPPTQGLSIDDKQFFAQCVNYLRGKSDFGFENDGHIKRRPRYVINDLINEYMRVFPQEKDFKTIIDGFNLYLKEQFKTNKFGLTGDTTIKRIERSGIYYGILQSEDFARWLSAYKAQM